MFFSAVLGAVFCFILWAFGSGFMIQLDFFNRERASPYECGFDSKQLGRTPFSLHFFLFVLLFLLFDLEVIFFFHLSLVVGWTFMAQLVFVLCGGLVFWSFMFEEGGMLWET